MPFTGKVAVGAPTFDHQTDSYDVTVDLIVLGLDCAFLKKDDPSKEGENFWPNFGNLYEFLENGKDGQN